MTRRHVISGALVALATATGATCVASAQGPPPPKGKHGAKVVTIAQGVPTPTSFAFGDKTIFVGAAGNAGGPKLVAGAQAPPSGGIYVIHAGAATLVPNTPPVVFGLAWHGRTLYATAGSQLIAYSGWNGVTFAHSRTIYTGPKSFPGLNGLTFGPDGRIYVGVTNASDHTKSNKPYAFDVLSLKPNGKDVKVFAKGLRQPWQLAFVAGVADPFITDLGQDAGAKNPKDYIVHAHAGDDYGFPTCNWVSPRRCRRFARPFKFFSPHTDPMGIGAIGKTLYVALFGGPGGQAKNPELISLSPQTGKVRAIATGYAAPVVALGVDRGFVYTGDLSGSIDRIKP